MLLVDWTNCVPSTSALPTILRMPTFSIFSESRLFREYLAMSGGMKNLNLTTSAQEELKRNWLTARSYTKGIASDRFDFDQDNAPEALATGEKITKAPGLWVSDWFVPSEAKDSRFKMRVRLRLNWQTLRYEWGVEYEADGERHVAPEGHFGRCEAIPSDVKQTGDRH